MRSRYRFYACPVTGCPKLRTQPGSCPEHREETVEVILRRETPEQNAREAADKARETAEKMRAAGDKVGQAAGKPAADPFGLADLMHKMGDDIAAGRPLTDREGRPFDHDDEDDDEDEDDGE